MKPILLVISGPTGVGKTELSLTLAQRYGAEIINADSRQVYRDLPIATAAPTPAQLATVCHHMVGTLGLDDRYSAADFAQQVEHIMARRPSSGSPSAGTQRVTLMAGGSMMYVDAAVRGIDSVPDVPQDIRLALRARLGREGLEPLVAWLRALDPDYCARIDPRNTQRVVHALEVCIATGRPFSSFLTGQAKPRPFHVVKVGLARPRPELYDRIDRRVDLMMEQGLADETLAVYRRYQSEVEQQLASVVRHPGPTEAQPIPNLLPPALNTVGLKEMLLCHSGIWTLSRATERIKHNTRAYSKRQMTWLKRDSDIRWFHPDDVAGICAYTDAAIASFTD